MTNATKYAISLAFGSAVLAILGAAQDSDPEEVVHVYYHTETEEEGPDWIKCTFECYEHERPHFAVTHARTGENCADSAILKTFETVGGKQP